LTEDNDVWWEGMTEEAPKSLISWTRQEWGPESMAPAAHPNARFCTPLNQCPVMDKEWQNPDGVPISAILLGGRRSQSVPLVFQSFDWEHGVFLGSVMSSESTAAAAGLRGVLRIDPFSMRPFCGYNMGDYFQHWLNIGANAEPTSLPKIFSVNWFRKDKNKFLWPGYGENIRVLKWIFDRCDQESTDDSNAIETPIGMIPKLNNFDLSGSKMENISENIQKVFQISEKEWFAECEKYEEFYKEFGERLPEKCWHQLEGLQNRLKKAAEKNATKTFAAP